MHLSKALIFSAIILATFCGSSNKGTEQEPSPGNHDSNAEDTKLPTDGGSTELEIPEGTEQNNEDAEESDVKDDEHDSDQNTHDCPSPTAPLTHVDAQVPNANVQDNETGKDSKIPPQHSQFRVQSYIEKLLYKARINELVQKNSDLIKQNSDLESEITSLKAAEEKRRKAEEDARKKALEEEQKKAGEESNQKAEKNVRERAREEGRVAQQKAEEEARVEKQKAEEEERKKSEKKNSDLIKKNSDLESEITSLKAAEEKRQKVEEDARKRALEEEQKKVEAKQKAEKVARERAEKVAREKAEEDAMERAREEARVAQQTSEEEARVAKQKAEEEARVAKQKAEKEKKQQAGSDESKALKEAIDGSRYDEVEQLLKDWKYTKVYVHCPLYNKVVGAFNFALKKEALDTSEEKLRVIGLLFASKIARSTEEIVYHWVKFTTFEYLDRHTNTIPELRDEFSLMIQDLLSKNLNRLEFQSFTKFMKRNPDFFRQSHDVMRLHGHTLIEFAILERDRDFLKFVIDHHSHLIGQHMIDQLKTEEKKKEDEAEKEEDEEERSELQIKANKDKEFRKFLEENLLLQTESPKET